MTVACSKASRSASRKKRLVLQRASAEAAAHRDLRAVVFEDIRNLKLSAEPRRCESCQAPDARRGKVGRIAASRAFESVIVEAVGLKQIDFVLSSDLRPQHLLLEAEFVQERVVARHEADEVFGHPRQFVGDVAGMAVASARDELRPIVGSNVDTQSLRAGRPGAAASGDVGTGSARVARAKAGKRVMVCARSRRHAGRGAQLRVCIRGSQPL